MAKHAPAIGNFNGGEFSPDVAGRVDNDKYNVGSATLQNFIPLIQGPAVRRPGTRLAQPVKDSTQRTWLRKFIFSQGQAFQIEFGVGYMRFYTNHGPLLGTGFATWAGGLTPYGAGAQVNRLGIVYYCMAFISINQAPESNPSVWYPMPWLGSSTVCLYEIPSPFTAATLTNADGSCALQFEQSGDVLYIANPSTFPLTLTRFADDNWILAHYAPPDGPFLPLNGNTSPAMWVVPIAGSPGQVTCFSSAPAFGPSDVAGVADGVGGGKPGRLVRIGPQYFNIPVWGNDVGISGAGQFRRFDGNTYVSLAAGTTGSVPPTHTFGVALDGQSPNVSSGANGVQWLYQDSGYGIGRVTGYTSPTQVTLTISPYADQNGNSVAGQFYNFPAAVVGSACTITGITAANPAVVSYSGSFSPALAVGDPVYLTGVGGMTQISEQAYVVTAIGSGTFTLGTVDASAYSAFTSGGSAVKNGTLNWQLGAWDYPAALGGTSPFPGSFPTCACFWADRLFWAGGIRWWGSVPGQYDSHTQDLYGVVSADCAITGILAAQDVDAITWMSPALFLLIGTKGGEFGMTELNPSAPLGPSNVSVDRQTKIRSRAIRPEIVGTTNLYVQLSGKKIMAQDYTFYLNRYDSTNQNRMANHIAGYQVGQGIIDIAWHAEPYECLWCATSQGTLIGFTFDKTDNVTGWHEHVLGATKAGPALVECVSVIPAPDGTRDEVWMIVNRTIGGKTVRTVEYMEKPFATGDAQSSMCYLDMSATYSGAPTTSITGLSALNGETVAVLRDGGGCPDQTVVAGAITLPTAGSVVQVGLACPANLVTMKIEGGADVGTAQGKVKRVSSATIRVKNTLCGKVGMASGAYPSLIELQPNQASTLLSSPPSLTTGDVAVSFPGDNETGCQIQISQPDPFCMELIGIFPIITVQEPSAP